VAGRDISTKQAAKILGVTDARVRQLIKEKKLAKKRKIGRDWLLDEDEVKIFSKQPPGKRGSPRRRIT
jgi:excisionase family DNA binding protein